MSDHPDKEFVTFLTDSLSNGFNILINNENIRQTKECHNLKSCQSDPDAVSVLIKEELRKGFIIGPYTEAPFDIYRVSPIGIVKGKYSGKKRLILDLSSPHNNASHSSINDLIDKEKCTLTYVKIDDAIRVIQEYGQGAILCKTDIQDAFKQIPVLPEQWRYLGFKWENLIYFYVRLPFGSRSSPKLFDNLSRAICWIAEHNMA